MKRLLWLAVVPVLFVADYGITGRYRIAELLRESEYRVTDYPPGEVARYAGADWRVVAARRISNDPPDPRLQAPKGAQIILVRAEVTGTGKVETPAAPQDSAEFDLDAMLASLNEGWGDCRASLSDAAGRIWMPSNPVNDRALRRALSPTGEEAPGCSRLATEPPPAGQTAAFEELFVIPADAKPPFALRISTRMDGRPKAIALALGQP